MPFGSCVEDFSILLTGYPVSTGVIYTPGDIVGGYLHLNLLQHISLSCIRITIKGRAFVHWTEQSLRGAGEPRFKDTRHHSASEDYFEQSLVLFGGQTKNDRPEKCYLPAGRYNYPFHYQLPAHLPCSFEGDYGYIRYWVKAVIEKGFEQCHVTKMPFTVISPLDLNAVPDSNVINMYWITVYIVHFKPERPISSYNAPVTDSTEKKLCCLCCVSGPISAMLCLQKRGFVPGEPIRFGAELSNLSSRKMASYSVELKMTTMFKTPIKSRSITRQICKVKRDSVGRGETDTWMCDQLVVPPLPPSGLHGCGIISVKYNVELRVDPVGPAFDLTLPLEVIIGTVPHRPHHDYVHYANMHHNSPASAQGSTTARNTHQRVHGGVPVLPVHGGHLIVNPAHATHSSNQSSCLYPGTSAASNRSAPERARPSSRASSSPSSASTLSLNQNHVHAIFAESAFGRVSVRFEEDSDHCEGQVKYAPVYPYYQWRK